MVVKVKGYYGTGLTPGNSLSNKDILGSAGVSFRTFPDVAVKQSRTLAIAKIAATWSLVADLDYVTINDDCYWVTAIEMLNDNVAQLRLMYDAITSVGISNVRVISGWCTRRCVNDDTLFANTISEAFTPQQELVIDFGSRLAPNTSKGQNNFVVLTCGLYEVPTEPDLEKQKATFYAPPEGVIADVGEFLGVVVPEVPELNDFTSFTMDMGTVFELLNSTVDSPMSSVFNLDSSKVQYTLSKLNALGLNNAIVYAYSIPDCYCSVNDIEYLGDEPVQIAHMHSKQVNLESTLPIKFGNYKNNKVYSGQFMTYTLLSMASGDGNSFPVDEIVSYESEGSQYVFYTMCADLQYIGYPFIFPTYYHGAFNKNMIGAVNGAQWMQAPIKEVGNEGYYWGQANKNLNATMAGIRTLGSALGVAGNVSGALADSSGALANYREVMGYGDSQSAAYWLDQGSNSWSGVNTKVDTRGIGSIVDAAVHFNGAGKVERSMPDVKFSQLYTMQNYFGNAFFEYRVRLSDADMERFDRYLTMFGYAVNEPLTSDCFKGREYFNFVKAEAVNIKTDGYPLHIRNQIVQSLEQGVRLWHVMPVESAFNDNPIVVG